MDELQNLYQQVIMDHSKHPRNFGVIDGKEVISGRCYNPLCGDHITIYALINHNMIEDLKFSGQGCAICLASASLMCEHMLKKNPVDVRYVFHGFLKIVKNEPMDWSMYEGYKKLEVFKGVGAFPMRVKCATCAWHSLLDTLKITVEERG